VKGAQVLQGQFIGNVDDTGYSTGHHLHYHVYTTPTSTYWGPSVDISFDDVDINGGRPRTCYEATTWPSLGSECHDGDTFTSQNFGADPPSAALTLPAQGEVITDGSLLVLAPPAMTWA
jgi:murein DD-endopeptidase MepM/ murein hydrolase activator NlpD